ncbi:DUF7848 domain-containing protein [Streptomyces sp. LZ34]
MTRATYRFREFTIRLDLRPEAEPITSTMRCAKCEGITRPYRFGVGAWQ